MANDNTVEEFRDLQVVDVEEGENEQATIQDLLAKQLELVQNLLLRNHAGALQKLSETVEATAQVKAENARLAHENLTLKSKLTAAGLNTEFRGFSDTGGSGDPEMQKTPISTPQPHKTTSGANAERMTKVKYGWEPLPSTLISGSGISSSTMTVALASPSHTASSVPKPGSSGVAAPPDNTAPPMDAPGVVPSTDADLYIKQKQHTLEVPGLVLTSPTTDADRHNKPKQQLEVATTEGDFGAIYNDAVAKNFDSRQDLQVTSVVPANPGLSASYDDARRMLQERARNSQAHMAAVKLKVEETKREEDKRRAKDPNKDKKEEIPKGEGPKQVFADAAEMKAKLRANLNKKPYDVSNFYWKTGLWQKIARHGLFENLTLGVIGINAVWISIDTDLNLADFILEAELVFQFAENLFCVYFSFEWFVRFMAFKKKKDGLKDAWFVFDTTLVFIMVAETWAMPFMVLAAGGGGGGAGGNAGILKLLRLMRLSRMARMARLFKAFPELMIMIKGMAVAMRSVFFTLCLLFIIVYVFAIAFVQLMGPRGALQPLSADFDEELFKSVPDAINNLMIGGTLPDQADIINTVGAEHFTMRFLIMVFILLAALTVMNMLVGVLCEVVSVVSAVEKESLLVNFVKTQLQDMLVQSGLDTDNNYMISRSEFESLLEKPEAAHALSEVGVDVIGLVDFTDFIFTDDNELSFGDFMDVVLQLRGSNTATVKDVVDLRKLVISQFDAFQSSYKRSEILQNAPTPSHQTHHATAEKVQSIEIKPGGTAF